jgi:hypothetical protein
MFVLDDPTLSFCESGMRGGVGCGRATVFPSIHLSIRVLQAVMKKK